MESDVVAVWLDSLVLKLRHPLTKIRSRALHTLLFKLRERLVRWQELEPLQSSLIPSLLACLVPPLELDTLHVLELLVQSQSEVFLAGLQHFGAAQKLQQAANKNPELQTSYEKLLRQIYVTKLVSVEDENRELVGNSQEEEEAEVEQFSANRVLTDRRRAPRVDLLEARGWRFAQVTLTSVDDQYLFEFEVKLQLRTESRDIVAACAKFRNELLRDFPAEVFLQRPAVLQYLLHLVQQPILPESPGTMSGESGHGDALMERAMEVSLGVNYFDEMLNKSFSNKRGNLSGAVVMASLKAVESLLYALKLSRRTCLDPTYVVYAPNVHVELFDSYDTRRVLYPRASMEVEDDVGRTSRQRGTSQLEQYSLSGAIYKIFISILPLMRSARHPRLHLLNLLSSALSDLPEKGGVNPADTSVQELDKLRLEHILDILSGICRPVSLEQAGNTMVDNELELTHCMTWKLVELVLQLLRLYPSSQYIVEEALKKDTSGGDCPKPDRSGGIIIPRLLWEAVKLWVAHPLFPEVAAQEWKDESLIQGLSSIDPTIPAFVELKHSSQQDARLILAFVDFAKTHREQLADFGPREVPAILNLEVAQKTIQTRYAFDDMDTEIIADATLQAIWSALTSDTENDNGRLTESEIETIQFVLCDLLSGLGETKASTSHDPMVFYFFRGLMDLIDSLSKETKRVSADCRHRFNTEVLCEPKFLTLLLLVLARQDAGDQRNNAAFWTILRAAMNQLARFSSDKLALLIPVVPMLQHFAYIDPSENSSREQRSTQPQLAEVLNRVETIVPDHTRHLLMCRCLLHESSYIRKAAASGILRLLSRVNPPCVDWISKHKEIHDDPFGGTFAYDNKDVNLEATLMETPLSLSRASEYQPSENELSSHLSKLSHLHKVISGSSSGFESMKEAALKELVMFIENASVEMFSLFEELDKFSEIMELLRAIFEKEAGRNDSSMTLQALLLFRTLLLRSRLLRSAMRRNCGTMELLMPLIFHSSASIRAQMYYILLLLTCSAENFIPTGAPVESLNTDEPTSSEDARIPEMLKSTFGLYSSRWTRCFIVTCSLKQQLQASSELLAKQTDSSWLQEVKKSITNSDGDETKRDGEFDSLLGAEYTLITQKLRDAPSHGKCLNAIYHVMTICTAWRFARARFVEEWEGDFQRYFAVSPKNERDEVIVGALVSILSVMFCAMVRGEQLRALVVVKRKVLPLLKRSQSKAFSLEVARLLLNVSESKVSDLFLSLAADTDIISTICTKYSAVYATEPVLHGLMLEVLLRFARGMGENVGPRLSEASREKICKRLLEMLSPLLTVVCRHRVPGSFSERDVFAVGSQCMVAILTTLPRESLLASDSPLEHTDSSILLDGGWASRFLFDHVAPIRELGFRVIEHAAASNPSSRLLEMAFETSRDDTESDAVRAAACSALTQEIVRYHERPPDRQAALIKMCHGTAFARKALRSLSGALKGNKLLARTASAFARLVRVLYIQKDGLASHFGDMQEELEAAEEEYDVYPLLIQVLSLREWKDKSDCYSSCCMLLPSCDHSAWRRSLLPAILDLMAEALNLLQAICRDGGFDQIAFFLMHTTLQYQLMELMRDIHASFDDTLSVATRRRHYQVLDLSAGTLSILLVQAFDQHNDYDSEQFGAPTTPGFGADFVDTVAKLLAPEHPIDFRVSFSRIVPAMSLLMPGSLMSSDASVVNALCSVVFDLYQEVAEFRPLDASTTTSDLQGRVFPLASIRRVSCALQVLLDTSPSIQPLVHVKRGVPFALASIKESFTAIRIAGGFGGKRARSSNPSTSTQDTYVLDLCGRIQTHMEVVSSMIGGDKESQQLAKNEGLLNVIMSNWNVMKTAHVRGSQLMLRALHLLANYIYGNDSARSSMLISPAPGSGRASGGDYAQTLLSLLFNLASTRGDVTSPHSRVTNDSTEADIALSNAACQVLKAALLHPECVQASVKSGSISRLVDSLQDRLKQARQTNKTNHLENSNLAQMLGVLSSIASTEEGARVLYSSLATVLCLVFDDVMHLSDKGIRRSGCLFLRNLSLSQATKNNFAVWEELLDEMVTFCVRASEGDVISLGHMSVALWSLVYDNQKARALLLSKPTTLQSLKEVLDSQTSGTLASASSSDIAENLRRVLMLVQE
ncbi:hypothetical protein PC129_g1774 [Phytophthora cactorum]|uniref:Armadillo-type fold n=1 Tax=Phytophthora cactorum TaxID=29920 RepID=A0A329RM72_9STRA|nr:hypothetical protein Pcac1_g9828 [Phytophthora cactorum]KAG2837592.1 hypothetical protein PC111_g4584 [Phytophthora cactorum]KAG2840715.1 hypothetical protein PC112_g3646 [Phytophthora cactorum]KAG2863104.1 hypothetical protein PC113_g5737 [Phytophthora cactorum]KAG2932358.1 hypothetical protein PC115_g5814 [Phytophthora cactorum]